MQPGTRNLAELTAALESDPRFSGKRLRDIPDLANFRRKWRAQCYWVANFGIFSTIFNAVLALSPLIRLWWVSLLCAAISLATVVVAETRARLISRQLGRPAALQIALDSLGRVNE